MKCKKCGAQLNEDALFCHKCGKAVPVDEYLNKFSEDDYEYDDERPRRGGRVIVVLLVTLILLVILGLAAVFSYLFVGSQSSIIKESAKNEPPAVASTVVPVTATETEAPTEKPRATAKPKSTDDYKHVEVPEYKTYTDSEYRFSCSYPAHFEKYIDNTSSGRYTVQANDGEVTLRICAEDNSAGITLQQSMSMFKSKHDGEVEYSSLGETYYAIRINDDGFCYYKYLRSKDKRFCWFEFTYPEEEKDIYEGYIQHIYNSFTVK